MPIKAKPIGEPYRIGQYNVSDFSDLNWWHDGMHFVVEFWNRNDNLRKKKFVEISFPKFCRYRVLEEIDLVSYWKSKDFSSGHIVYEILSGGWLSSDAAGERLLWHATVCGFREWFICTSDLSVCVLSKEEPLVKVLEEG